jgi:hypothetical protein
MTVSIAGCRVRRAVSAVVLVIAACLVAIGIAEVLLRTVVRVPGDEPMPPAAAPPSPQSEIARAARYIHAEDLPASADVSWFQDDPQPLPHPPASEAQTALYQDYLRRGLYGPQSGYIWNPEFFRQRVCVGKSTMFANYPDSIEVFDPPSNDQFPRFRFMPGAFLPSGLISTAFGLRGPEISLGKPPRTVRIAFAGASTTVDLHNYAASSPEWAVHWLNRLSNSRGWDVKFEVLNAGREGVGSSDIAAIVQQELVPLDPDLVVYMEGANQFGEVRQIISPQIRARPVDDEFHRVPLWPRKYSAVARLVDRATMVRLTMLDEPAKPHYTLKWPEGAPASINLEGSDLPLDLPTIRKDLDAIGGALRPYGADLAVSSFFWLAQPGLRLSADRHRYIYRELNDDFWPLTYADIQKLADYQNRFFREYSEKRGAYFIDLASRIPYDPDLFTDAILMTEAGVRLKGWLNFELLAPFVERKIETGQWPRPAQTGLPPPPSLAHHPWKIACAN